ncbi:hypothetical protein AB0J72_51450 [Dactylosporangium sp. NPDC049742]|uniref:hypothetical protein n=1 Tax=Dactylosporangium sp. NPDC049742 TaxID=3154737 RepID=UPI00343F9A20
MTVSASWTPAKACVVIRNRVAPAPRWPGAGEEAPERLGVRAVAGDVLDAVLKYLDDADVRIGQAAVFAVTRFVQLLLPECRGTAAGAAAGDRVAVVVRRLRVVAGRDDGGVGAAAAYALAELGADTADLLDRAALAVRACTALSPATAGDARAVAALEEALRHTPDNDDWLGLGSRLQRLRLHMEFAAAGERAGGFDELVPGALVVATPEAGTTGNGWGPLLRVAFPPGWQERPLTGNQREFLHRLVGNDSVWGEWATDTPSRLAAVGLPPDREACRTLIGARAGRDRGRRGGLGSGRAGEDP